MKVLILTQYFPPEIGAAPTRLAAMSRELQKMGHSVEVITALPNYPKGRIFQDYRGKFYDKGEFQGAIVHRFWLYASMGSGIKRLASYLTFAGTVCFGIFKAKKPDFIFVNSGPLFLFIPSFIASKFWRVPYIFNVADLWPDSAVRISNYPKLLVRLLYWMEKKAYQKALYVTGVTQGLCDIICTEKAVPEKKVNFLPNGVDPEVFYPQEKNIELVKKHKLQGKIVFCYPGTHGYLHALENILEAGLLLEDLPVVFMLVGGGSEKDRLVQMAQKKKVRNVLFIPPQDQKDLASYISVADYGLIHQKNTPLANETRPAKCFPLMAMEKPLLFAGFGEGADMIAECGAGRVIPPENPEGLAQEVRNFVNKLGSQDMISMGKKGKNFVNNHYTWGALVKKWWSTIELPGARKWESSAS